MAKGRYRVWADSQSVVYVSKSFNDLDRASEWASAFVHKYDGKDAERVIVHIEDEVADTTIATYENLNKCDIWP